MLKDDYSRREFLIKFARLSAGSLALSAVAMACYGTGPYNYPAVPMVSSMYFTDAQSNNVALYDNQDVPVHTKFIIEFTDDMNTSAPTTVFFTGPGDAPVEYNNKIWETAHILSLAPAADLSPDTSYTLSLGDDAEDTNSNKIVLTESATATFKTAAA